MSRKPGASSTSKKPLGPSDVPAVLSLGTDVSAKFKGAFCEAKIHSFEKKLVEIRAQPLKEKDESIPADHVYTHEDVQGKMEVGNIVQVSYKRMFVEARITHVKDLSQYKIVFNDGDERIVKRNQMLLKGEKHYDSQSNLDNLPLTTPESMKSTAVDDAFLSWGTSRSATRQLKAIMEVEKRSENQSEKMISAWSSLSDLSSSDEESFKSSIDEGPSTSKKTKKGDETPVKKKGSKRSASPKNEFNEGTAVIIRMKAQDTNKITMAVGVIVSPNAYNSSTNDRSNKQFTDNEIPVRCLPKGDYRIFKPNQIALYDENKISLESLNAKMRESCEVILRYKNKGRLPNGWTDESIHGTPQPTKKSRKNKRHNPKNVPRRDKFYRQLNDYYKNIVELNFPKLNPTTKNGVELDLCRLFFTVRQEGGYRATLSFPDKWQKIVQKLKWSDIVTGEELREIYHSRLETFEYFQDRMAENKSSAKAAKEEAKTTKPPSSRLSHASTPTPSLVDRNVRTTPKKSQTPAATERKRKAQPTTVPKKQRRGSASSDSEGRPSAISSRKGSSSSPHPSQKVRVSPTELDASDGYVAADIFSQIVETKIIRAAHRTKFYSARVVDARRPPIEIVLRVLTKLTPVVGTSNNYKFTNRLHRDALIELGRLTAAFVHYCGWNNRFDEWISIDRIKVSPETKRLSMLTLIRTYSFPSNLLEAIHAFFKRRRITREKYKARRRANNSDETAEDDDGKKGPIKKKESAELDGPPGPITLYPELQKFLYDDEDFKIPVALPEKIEKDEYDEVPNDEFAASNAMISDAEVNNEGDESDTANTPTTSKRPLKRKKTKPMKEEEPRKASPVKEKPVVVEAKKEPEDQQIAKKKKKLVEEKPKKPAETPKTAQKQKEEAPKGQQKSTKDTSTTKSSATIQKQAENREEKVKEKPTTRSETPSKKQKVDYNINRPLDFMSGIPTDEVKSGKSTPKSSQLKAQKSEDVSVDIPISIAIPSQTSTPKGRMAQTPISQPEPSIDLPSPKTPSRRGAKNLDRQQSVTETLSSPKPQQEPIVEKEPVKEEQVDFKPFSPITPPPVSTTTTTTTVKEPIVEPLKLAETTNIQPSENQFSPRSRFLHTLNQQPQPTWRLPNPQQSDAELAAQFEVHEDRRQLTLEALRHIPPALLASHLNIPLQQLNQASLVQTSVVPSVVAQQQIQLQKPQLTTSSVSSTPQQLFTPPISLNQTPQQPTTSFNQLNPQILALLQNLHQQNLHQQNLQQQNLQQQNLQQQNLQQQNLQQQNLQKMQIGASTSINQQISSNSKTTIANQQQQQTKPLLLELEQTPALKCLTEYVLLLQYLSVDPTTQETLELLRRNFSMTRYDGLRLIRPQFVNVINRIALLDAKANEFMDPVMRPLVEQFVSTKISEMIRKPGGLTPILQQFVHPLIYNQILTLPSPSQLAPLNSAQLQLLINQQKLRQLTGLTQNNLLSEQLLAQQQAQLSQQSTADQIHARLQTLLMAMHTGGTSLLPMTSTISPPNDPRPSISASIPQSLPQSSTTTSNGTFNQCPLIYVPGVFSTKQPETQQTSINQREQELNMQVESVQMLTESAKATLNLTISNQQQNEECNQVWPSAQTIKLVASLSQKECEDCGANPSVVEMNLLNQLPFHVRSEILDSYAKTNKMSKERRNRPQCKVKNLTKQAQKLKIEQRRNEDILEKLRNSNGKDFMMIDKRFCDQKTPGDPPLMYDIFSSIGFDIFATDRLPESAEIKQKTETSIKEMTKEEVHENVLKLMKEHNINKEGVNMESLEDLAQYINTLSDIAVQHQVRLGLANYNIEMSDEITNSVITQQTIIDEEQRRCENNEEAFLSNSNQINKNRPKNLLHRGRKGYY